MPATSTVHRSRRLATAALASLALVSLAGCGSSDDAAPASAGSSDLAELAPASSMAYGQASFDLSGDQKKAVDAFSSKVLKQGDPAVAIQRAYDKDKGSGAFDREIRPWVGDEAAFVVTGATSTSSDPDLAIIADAKDGKAQSGVDTIVKSSGGTARDGEYGGVKYKQTDDTLAGVVDDKVVAASTPAAFRGVVDASKGSGLDKSADFKSAMGALDGEPVGSVYLDLRRIVRVAATDPSLRGQGGTLESALQGVRGAAFGLSGDESTLRVTSAVLGSPQTSGDASATLASLPAGSWVAAGLGDVGQSLTRSLQQFQKIAAASGTDGRSFQQGLDQVQSATGLDLQRDVLSWMGDGGLFVRGAGLTDIGGALVVRTKDPATTKSTLAKVRSLVERSGQRTEDLSGNGVDSGFSVTAPNLPVQLLVGTGGDKFVVAVNPSAFKEAFDTTSALKDDPAFKAAAQSLGDGYKPTAFLDLRTVVSLVGLAAGSDPSFQQARPYLDAFTTVAAGSKRDGDIAKSSVAIGLR